MYIFLDEQGSVSLVAGSVLWVPWYIFFDLGCVFLVPECKKITAGKTMCPWESFPDARGQFLIYYQMRKALIVSAETALIK